MATAFENFISSNASGTPAPAAAPAQDTAPAQTGGTAFSSFLKSSGIQPQVQTPTQTEQQAPQSDSFAGTKADLSDIVSNPLSLGNFTKIPSDVEQTFGDAWTNLKNNWQGYTQASNPNVGFAGKLGATLKLVSGAAGLAFSPVTALFKGGEDIPAIGTVVKGVDTAFTAAGEAGSAGGQKLIDQLPIKDQKEKQTLKEGVGDIFGLAAQIALGKGAEIAGAKIVGEPLKVASGARTFTDLSPETRTVIQNSLDEKYGKVDAQTIVDKANDLANQHPEVQKEVQAKVDAAAEKVANPTPEKTPEQVSVENSAQKVAEATPPPVETPTETTKVEEPKTAVETLTQPETPKVEEPTQPKIEGNKITGKASDVNRKLVEKGFDNIPEEEQAKFASSEGQRKTQIEAVAKFMDSNIEDAKQVALGNKEAPEGVPPQILHNAMVEYADKQGNYALLRDLAGSKHATELSTHASELESAKYGKSKTETAGKETVRAIKEQTKAREEFAEKTAKKEGTTVKRKESVLKEKGARMIKDKIVEKKSFPKLEEFIKNITC